MPSSAPAKTVRVSCGCTVRPKTRLSLHSPFMTRRQLSPPSPLSHSPLPIVPAQIVYFPAIASSLGTPSSRRQPGLTIQTLHRLRHGSRLFRDCGFVLVRAFPAGMRDVDDDPIGAGPFHLEIGLAAGRHCRIDMVLSGQPLRFCVFEFLAGLVEIIDLEAEMMDAVEVRPMRADIGRCLGLIIEDRDVDVAVSQEHRAVWATAQFL